MHKFWIRCVPSEYESWKKKEREITGWIKNKHEHNILFKVFLVNSCPLALIIAFSIIANNSASEANKMNEQDADLPILVNVFISSWHSVIYVHAQLKEQMMSWKSDHDPVCWHVTVWTCNKTLIQRMEMMLPVAAKGCNNMLPVLTWSTAS